MHASLALYWWQRLITIVLFAGQELITYVYCHLGLTMTKLCSGQAHESRPPTMGDYIIHPIFDKHIQEPVELGDAPQMCFGHGKEACPLIQHKDICYG